MAVDKAFDYLDAPVTRLPYNDRLDLEVIPSQECIVKVVHDVGLNWLRIPRAHDIKVADITESIAVR